MTWAFYSVLLQPYVARYSSTRVNAIVSVACCVPFLAVASPALAREEWSETSALVWACLLFSSVLAYALTNLVWLYVIERVGTARAAVYANLQPFLGSIFAVLILSETMAPVQIVGGVVIAAGIVLARWRRPLEPSPD
jgi:drug/metabolite transporter (DMT)-like permease